MAASRHDIKGWFEEGRRRDATHMVVVCDTFDHSDYPVYVHRGLKDPHEIVRELEEKEMSRVMEVYALHLDMEGQLNERFARNYEAPPAAIAAPAEEPPTPNTRWDGSTPEKAIAELERRLGASRQATNTLHAHILAALLSNRTDTRAILLRALEGVHEPRRPKRARRHTRRLLLQAAKILEDRP